MAFLFESNRFGYREMQGNDAHMAYELNLAPEVLDFTGDEPFASVQEAKTFLESYTDYHKKGMGRWAVVHKKTGQALGWCGLKLHDNGLVDLGYRILKQHWGQGIATEASLACLRYGFETLNLEEVVARAVLRNSASIRVMQKCGLVFSHKSIDELHGEEIVTYKITHDHFSRH